MTSRVIRGPKEDQLHLSVAQLLDWVLLPPAFYTTFPAGWGVLSPSMAQRLKRSGLKAGMPDILLFYEGLCYGIELKAGKNSVTPEQKATIIRLQRAGVPVWVCKSIDDVIDVLHINGFPTRGMDTWQRNTRDVPLDATSAKLVAKGGEEGDVNGAG